MRTSALLLVALALGACSDAVDPTLGTSQAFSLYGYLDPTADRQAIRVAPIIGALDADTARTLAAAVTSTSLQTGRTVTWRDSVVDFRDGSVGHVFVADYTPTPGETVEIEVRETTGEGRTTTVSVEIPPLAQSSVGQPTFEGGLTAYPVTVRAPRVIGGTLRLYVTGLPTAPADTSTLVVPVEAGALAITNDGDEWTTTVPFLEATRDFLQSRGQFNTGLGLVEAEFAPFVTTTEWAVPPGGLDEEAIAEPGTFSNVAGGFGFVGAGYEAPVRWVPSPGTQSRAGFSINSDPAGLVVINEVSDGYVELYNPTLEPVNVGGYVVSMGAPEEGTRIPNPTTIEGEGFLVVDGPFAVVPAGNVTFSSPSGREVSRMYIDQDLADEPQGASWGSYPDGLSFPVRSFVRGEDGHDLFRGPLRSTRGRPNRPLTIPAVINEVSTSGAGFVEVLRTSNLLATASVATTPRGLFGGAGAAPVDGDFWVADEADGFALDQAGGTLYLVAQFYPVDDIGQTLIERVVDARAYGPQTPGRSAGYVPDGQVDPLVPDAGWRLDLAPTRGAPNAPPPRFASREPSR
ncbi:hypothetical protein [Rubrivirga sp.]|uniref:hypothetical protein n=1 Tax=Rubrivirga sp. TaxID=1885344 RepID=UPI003B5170FA